MDPSPDSRSGIIQFRLEGRAFGLPVDDVREVVPMAWLDRPPQLSSLVEGVLNLGGQAVPVLRLDRMLGFEPGRYGYEASILIMRPDSGGGVFGLLVGHVDGVRERGEFSSMDLPAGQSFNGCLAGMLERDGTSVSLLAWDRILLEQERVQLSEFQARVQARLDDLPEAVP